MEAIILFLKIMVVNIVLSGDNAVVIAMASKNLPPEQRSKAVWWGAAGAVGLRLVLTVAAVILLDVPFIQAIGALLLLYIAIKLLLDDQQHGQIKQASTLTGAIWTIVIADIVMSLDNVLAIAAIAKGSLPLIMLGIGISIPLIVWGSGLILKLLSRFPIFIYVGAGILGYTAGEMLVGDAKLQQWLFLNSAGMHVLIPLFGVIIVIGSGLIRKLRWFRII